MYEERAREGKRKVMENGTCIRRVVGKDGQGCLIEWRVFSTTTSQPYVLLSKRPSPYSEYV